MNNQPKSCLPCAPARPQVANPPRIIFHHCRDSSRIRPEPLYRAWGMSARTVAGESGVVTMSICSLLCALNCFIRPLGATPHEQP